MLDCPMCASGNIEHKEGHPMNMTNDEAQDWLLAQHNAAPGPPDPARFGAAIRAIRAKAIADAKEWAVEPVDTGLRDMLEQLAEASRDFTITRYRHVYGTDGGRTDEQMDAATQRLLDTTALAFLRLATGSEATPEDVT